MRRRVRRRRALRGMDTPALSSIRSDPAATQRCLDHFTTQGRWAHDPAATPTALEDRDELWRWEGVGDRQCPWQQRQTAEARSLLKDQHVFVIGDLAARLWFSALIYLVNGTSAPSEVAEGFPMHKDVAGGPCAWNPNRMVKGGYDFGGWAQFKKSSPCFLRWYGAKVRRTPELVTGAAVPWRAAERPGFGRRRAGWDALRPDAEASTGIEELVGPRNDTRRDDDAAARGAHTAVDHVAARAFQPDDLVRRAASSAHRPRANRLLRVAARHSPITVPLPLRAGICGRA